MDVNGRVTSVGSTCSICGYGVDVPWPFAWRWLVDLCFVPHNIWAWFSSHHVLRTALWNRLADRGIYLDPPWTEGEALAKYREQTALDLKRYIEENPDQT